MADKGYSGLEKLKRESQRRMAKGRKSFSVQIIPIFAILIVALFGSALFFAYLNTSSMKSSVETETTMAAGILARVLEGKSEEEMERILSSDHVRAENQSELEGSGQDRADLTGDGKTVAADPDDFEALLMSADGKVLYGAESMEKEGKKTGLEQLTGQWKRITDSGNKQDVSLVWVGKENPFVLKQSLFVVQKLEGDDLYLVLYNRCISISRHQRQQFALFTGIEVVLLLLIVILMANTVFSYRREIIRLATLDELTGLANRKSFLITYGEYMEERKAGKKKEPYSLFLMDIDYFKHVNDNYGHASGDKALAFLADHIKALVHEYGGFAGRWGGDEFIGVLPLSGEEAYQALSRMGEEIRSKKCDDSFYITVSAGVVEDREGIRLAHLSEMADLALYASKEGGRDQVSLYTEDMAKKELSVQEASNVPAAALTESGGKGTGTGGEEKEEESRSRISSPYSIQETGKGFKEKTQSFIRETLFSSTLMGVKWMAPFVAAGGLLIGLAFLFDALSVDMSTLSVAERSQLGSITPQAVLLKDIGDITFNFMLPVFAGFMAFGIAGEEAFLAGFAGGYMTIQSNSGFIGAMVAGLLAGVMTVEMKRFVVRLPKIMQKALPIIILPVLSLLLMQMISTLLISPVSALVGSFFKKLLKEAAVRNPLLSGTLAGGMMAMDMGGIVNKVAYNFGVKGLEAGNTGFMACVMAGGMVPPIGIALSVFFFPDRYEERERDTALSTFFMGLSFITEGALPFVFTDVWRVILSSMAGSACAGFLSALFGCTLPAPHGGIFVIPVMGHPLLYVLAVGIGSILTAAILGKCKKR
ncbi:MAG: diguanylate cyclase [Eubacterium sp.]|nr:diguanylate cyclase [Eubacterium sp.]